MLEHILTFLFVNYSVILCFIFYFLFYFGLSNIKYVTITLVKFFLFLLPITPDREEHKHPPILPHLWHLDDVPILPGSHPEAADALRGGYHLPGGWIHPRAGHGAAAATSQPNGGRADGAVVQRHHRGVAPAEGEHVQVGTEPDMHAAQRRHLHYEPGRQPAHQPGTPRFSQI